MRLTLHTSEGSVQFDITPEDFFRLRRTGLDHAELSAIAERCNIAPDLLETYIRDLHTAAEGAEEMDGACDYTDHFA
jgi:hypothetical protein